MGSPPSQPSPPPCIPPSYLALEEPLRALCTACTMASRSMPKTRSSSWGLPLRGTWLTARRCTEKPVSLTTAELTASPRPPGRRRRRKRRSGGSRVGSSHNFQVPAPSATLNIYQPHGRLNAGYVMWTDRGVTPPPKKHTYRHAKGFLTLPLSLTPALGSFHTLTLFSLSTLNKK